MKIKVNGVIISNDDKWIYDWFEMDSVCPKEIEAQIEAANGEDLEVEIDSPGGDMFAGSSIYTALKSYAGDVVIKIIGFAASAASVIAMAGKRVLMSPTAQLMIHNVWTQAKGDYKDFEHQSEVLKSCNKSIANAYQIKTGMTQDELLKLMNKETWMTAQEAIKNKFVDEIMFDNGLQLVASTKNVLLPSEVINKMKNLRTNGKDLPKFLNRNSPEESRQVPVDLYTKLYENLERRAQL